MVEPLKRRCDNPMRIFRQFCNFKPVLNTIGAPAKAQRELLNLVSSGMERQGNYTLDHFMVAVAGKKHV